MNARGERILIFGDSLTAHSAATPAIWNVNAGSQRASATPGDLLASLLAEQGAAAVRTNGRVGRSAWNFWQRETANQIIADDQAWQPTKVVVMLGTNDVGLSVDKDKQAMVAIRDAYKKTGAEVWAIGPFLPAVNGTPSDDVVAMMRDVFGGRFIDGRPLQVSSFAEHSADGIHYTATGARDLSLVLADALLSKTSPTVLATGAAMGVGILVVIAGALLWNRKKRTGALLGPKKSEKSEWSEIDSEYAGTVQSLIDDGYSREDARASAEENIRETYGPDVLLWLPKWQRKERGLEGLTLVDGQRFNGSTNELIRKGYKQIACSSGLDKKGLVQCWTRGGLRGADEPLKPRARKQRLKVLEGELQRLYSAAGYAGNTPESSARIDKLIEEKKAQIERMRTTGLEGVKQIDVPFPYERKPQIPSGWHKTARVETIDPSKLIATQRYVTAKGVRKYKAESTDDAGLLPLVYRTADGRLYIADGHHRIVAATKGKRAIQARVVDIVDPDRPQAPAGFEGLGSRAPRTGPNAAIDSRAWHAWSAIESAHREFPAEFEDEYQKVRARVKSEDPWADDWSHDEAFVKQIEGVSRSLRQRAAKLRKAKPLAGADDDEEAKIRKGTRGIITSVDGRAAAALFEGAQVRVIARRYFPDGVVVETLNDGPTWKRGTVGEVPLRYFKKTTRRSKSLAGADDDEETEARGQCFPWAHANVRSGTLVHGVVRHPWSGKAYPHAWVERNGRVYDWQSAQGLGPGAKGWTTADFYAAYKPTKIARYVAKDAKKQSWLKHGPLEGPPVLDVPRFYDEDDDGPDAPAWGTKEWQAKADASRVARKAPLRMLLAEHDAVWLNGKYRRVLAIKSPEMVDFDQGSVRVSEFDEDGPISHKTGKSTDKLADDLVDMWDPKTVEPATAAEIDALMSTPRFAEGSARVIEIQKLNSKGLKGWREDYSRDIKSATSTEVDAIEQRARDAGAKGELTYVGAGAEGVVLCDDNQRAFKLGRHGSLADEAEWLRMANTIPSIKQHVPKFFKFDEDANVIVRECVTPRERGRRHDSNRLYKLHERLAATMAPYGHGRPEFKPDSYVYTKRGPVLVDAGFAIKRGRPLVKEATALLKQDAIAPQDARDMGFALRMEKGSTVPAPIADRLLRKLHAREPSVDLDGLKGPQTYAKASERVDGRLVLDEIPNRESISATLDEYEILPGVREVSIPAELGPPTHYYSASERTRTLALAERIRESREIAPLIVVDDGEDDPYVLEGGHRFDALRILGAKSYPALVVLDKSRG